MFQTENLQEKWQNPVLEHPELPKIGDSYRRRVRYYCHLGKPRKTTKRRSRIFGRGCSTNSTGAGS